MIYLKIDPYIISIDRIHGVYHKSPNVLVGYVDNSGEYKQQVTLEFPDEEKSKIAYEAIAESLGAM